MNMNAEDSGLHVSRRIQNEGISEYYFNILYVKRAGFCVQH
jgi:hypothetical protein